MDKTTEWQKIITKKTIEIKWKLMQAAFSRFTWARVKIDLFRSVASIRTIQFYIINLNETVAVADTILIKGP